MAAEEIKHHPEKVSKPALKKLEPSPRLGQGKVHIPVRRRFWVLSKDVLPRDLGLLRFDDFSPTPRPSIGAPALSHHSLAMMA